MHDLKTRKTPGQGVFLMRSSGVLLLFLGLFQMVDFSLQVFQKFAGVRAVHLCMMKLKGDREGVSKEMLAVLAPDDKRIVEDAAVHAHCTVDFGVHNGGGADDHGVVGQVVAKQVAQASECMNIRFIDHVILTDGAFYSYADEGRI